MVQVADETAAGVVAERQSIAGDQPCDRDDGDRDEAHHDHVQHARRAHHAAVEDGETGRHQEHQGGAGKQPGGRGRVDLHSDANGRARL
jgi:hypothetical protein